MTLKGTKVVWIHGAVGLTGVCTGEVELLPSDNGGLYVLLKVQTERGEFSELPRNLELQ